MYSRQDTNDRLAVQFRNYFLSSLSDDDLAVLIPHFSERILGPGDVLFEAGAPVLEVIFPSHAVLSVLIVMRDGQGVECATIGRESAAGLLAALTSGVSTNQVFCQIPGSAMALPAALLKEQALRSPGLLDLTLKHVQLTIAQEEQSVACNARHPAPQRLARWLLLSQDRTGARIVPLTQEYLAVMLGVQRAAVGVAASRLRDEGLIRYSRGQVQILDREGLEHRACECYGAVKATAERVFGGSGAEGREIA